MVCYYLLYKTNPKCFCCFQFANVCKVFLKSKKKSVQNTKKTAKKPGISCYVGWYAMLTAFHVGIAFKYKILNYEIIDTNSNDGFNQSGASTFVTLLTFVLLLFLYLMLEIRFASIFYGTIGFYLMYAFAFTSYILFCYFVIILTFFFFHFLLSLTF